MLIQIHMPDTCRECYNCVKYDESASKYLCNHLAKFHFVVGDTHLEDCIIDPNSNQAKTCPNAIPNLV